MLCVCIVSVVLAFSACQKELFGVLWVWALSCFACCCCIYAYQSISLCFLGSCCCWMPLLWSIESLSSWVNFVKWNYYCQLISGAWNLVGVLDNKPVKNFEVSLSFLLFLYHISIVDIQEDCVYPVVMTQPIDLGFIN